MNLVGITSSHFSGEIPVLNLLFATNYLQTSKGHFVNLIVTGAAKE